MVSVVTENDIEKLKKYVIFHDCEEEHIVELCKKQPPVTLTVYRGQQRNETLHDANTYSCSLSELESSKFAGENCCLFVIHLINVPCIDVNALIGKEIGVQRRKEQEIIVLGGGKFYSDQSFSEEGFVEIAPNFNKRRFECWYTQEKHNTSEKKTSPVDHLKIKRALDTIDESEYEFIDSIDDIILPELHLTPEEKFEILNIIRKIKNGGAQMLNKKNNFRKTNFKIKSIRNCKKNKRKISQTKNTKRKKHKKNTKK